MIIMISIMIIIIIIIRIMTRCARGGATGARPPQVHHAATGASRGHRRRRRRRFHHHCHRRCDRMKKSTLCVKEKAARAKNQWKYKYNQYNKYKYKSGRDLNTLSSALIQSRCCMTVERESNKYGAALQLHSFMSSCIFEAHFQMSESIFKCLNVFKYTNAL